MEWVASTLHTTSERGVSSITTADAHTSASQQSTELTSPADLNGLVPFRRKTKSGFCACAITFQTHSTCIDHNALVCSSIELADKCAFYLRPYGKHHLLLLRAIGFKIG
jgi:hypothetical protein